MITVVHTFLKLSKKNSSRFYQITNKLVGLFNKLNTYACNNKEAFFESKYFQSMAFRLTKKYLYFKNFIHTMVPAILQAQAL